MLVRELSTGEHFGELALLTPEPAGGKRYLSIRVKSEECELVYLCRTDFQKIVGNISNYLKMNYGGEFDTSYTQNPVAAARELARKQGRR